MTCFFFCHLIMAARTRKVLSRQTNNHGNIPIHSDCNISFEAWYFTIELNFLKTVPDFWRFSRFLVFENCWRFDEILLGKKEPKVTQGASPGRVPRCWGCHCCCYCSSNSRCCSCCCRDEEGEILMSLNSSFPSRRSSNLLRLWSGRSAEKREIKSFFLVNPIRV